MSQIQNSIPKWTEKIKSDSRVLDPLGIEYHLRIQRDFVPGITSVTRRMRYYTLQAWFFKNKSEKFRDPHKLERLFILATLQHHKGDYTYPSIKHIFNKEKFKDNWNDFTSFHLDSKNFSISGFGRNYYVRQLAIFRSAWSDYKDHTTPINDKWSKVIHIDTKPLEDGFISKKELDNYSELCICNSESNQTEIDIFSKVLFGFINYQSPEDIDDSILSKYANGGLELNFIGNGNVSQVDIHRELNMRRRNTLLLYMKIIDVLQPPKKELERNIWDAIYYRQDFHTNTMIKFGRLDKIQKYWEVHQFLIYYVYAIESMLDAIQSLLRKNVSGIRKNHILSYINFEIISDKILDLSGKQDPIDTLENLVNLINKVNLNKISDLNSHLNESIVYDIVLETDSVEEKLGASLILLVLLRKRFDFISPEILHDHVTTEEEIIIDELNIFNFIHDFDNSGQKRLADYLESMFGKICNKHIFESSKRYHDRTKNWIFSEDDGYLYASGRKLVQIHERNNRWNPIFNLLKDAHMLEDADTIRLTKKGKQWLKMID